MFGFTVPVLLAVVLLSSHGILAYPGEELELCQVVGSSNNGSVNAGDERVSLPRGDRKPRLHVRINDLLVEVMLLITVKTGTGGALSEFEVPAKITLSEPVSVGRAAQALRQSQRERASKKMDTSYEKPLACEDVLSLADSVVQRECSVGGMVQQSPNDCMLQIACSGLLQCTGAGCSFESIAISNFPDTDVHLQWNVSDGRGIAELNVTIDGETQHDAHGSMVTSLDSLPTLRVHYKPQVDIRKLMSASHLAVHSDSQGDGTGQVVNLIQPTRTARPQVSQRTVVMAIMPHLEPGFSCEDPFYKHARSAIELVLSELNHNDYAYVASPLVYPSMQFPKPVPLLLDILRTNRSDTTFLCDPSQDKAAVLRYYDSHKKLALNVYGHFMGPSLEACRAQGSANHVILLAHDAFNHLPEHSTSPHVRRHFNLKVNWAKILKNMMRQFREKVNAHVTTFYLDFDIERAATSAKYFERFTLSAGGADLPGVNLPMSRDQTLHPKAKACLTRVSRYIFDTTRVRFNDTASEKITAVKFSDMALVTTPSTSDLRVGSVDISSTCESDPSTKDTILPNAQFSTLSCMVDEYSQATGITSLLSATNATTYSFCNASDTNVILRLAAKPPSGRPTSGTQRSMRQPADSDVNLAASIRLNRLSQYSIPEDWASCIDLLQRGHNNNNVTTLSLDSPTVYDMLTRPSERRFEIASRVYYYVTCHGQYIRHADLHGCPAPYGTFNKSWVRNVDHEQPACPSSDARARSLCFNQHASRGPDTCPFPDWLLLPPNDALIHCVESQLGLPQLLSPPSLERLARKSFGNAHNKTQLYAHYKDLDAENNRNFYEYSVLNASAELMYNLYPHLYECTPDPFLMSLVLARDAHTWPLHVKGRGFHSMERYCSYMCRPKPVRNWIPPHTTPLATSSARLSPANKPYISAVLILAGFAASRVLLRVI